MQFFTGSNATLDAVTDARTLVRSSPRMADALDAVAELRAADDGSLHRGSEFRRIASLSAPLFCLSQLLEPGFLDKRTFYAWLRRNREHCTYQIAGHAKRPSNTLTWMDGKAL